MNRTRRILVVTSGLLVAGAIFGALASALAVTVWLTIAEGGRGLSAEVLLGSGVIGAANGAVVGPPTAWVFLRRVPVGSAVVGTALGATVVGAASAIVGFHPIIGAFIGFIAAAAGLRYRHRQSAVAAAEPGEALV